jgi:hypothetical protein
MSGFLAQLEAAGIQAVLQALAALEQHWQSQGTSVVGVLDQLGQQAGLTPLPPAAAVTAQPAPQPDC